MYLVLKVSIAVFGQGGAGVYWTSVDCVGVEVQDSWVWQIKAAEQNHKNQWISTSSDITTACLRSIYVPINVYMEIKDKVNNYRWSAYGKY